MEPTPRLLPADRYLASVLGISDEEFAWYKAEVAKRAAEGPQPAVVAGTETLAIISLVLTVLSVGFTIAASFFKPKPGDSDPAQLKVGERGGRARTQNERFAPRYGFDSTQDIATLGSIIPVVYALRENGFGGVRVNTPLLWSQIYSLGGSQLLRAVFMIGEGPIGAIDTQNFASGGNTLASYNYGSTAANAGGSRMSVYGRYTSSLTTRLTSGNHIYGRSASDDKGNAQTEGGSDVFMVRRNGVWTSDFCGAIRPTNQTTFGVYGLIGNNLGIRLNPVIKPQVQAQLIPEGEDGDAKIKCTYDDVAWAQRKKSQTMFGTRSGITSEGLNSIGGTTSYTLYRGTDADTSFSRDVRNLLDISKWDKSSIEQIRTGGGGAFNKSVNADSDSKGRWIFEFDNTQEDSLLNRISVTITRIELQNNGKRGKLRAQITFRTGTIDGEQLWSNDLSSDETIPRLEALKATKFRLRFGNVVDDSVEDDDVVVRYTLRVRVKHKRKQKFKYSDNTFTVENEAFTPTFKIKDSEPIVPANPAYGEATNIYTVEGNGTLRITVELSFPVKNVYIEKCEDIASTVAGRQKSWDDGLIEGELYKIGSGLAICTDRTAAAFVSNADVSNKQGTAVTASFSTVRTGTVTTYSSTDITMDGKYWYDNRLSLPWRNVATTGGHILRCAIASISTSRPCIAVEFGIRSRLGIRVSGICNFRDSLSYDECDKRACLDHKNDKVDRGATLKVDVHQSNTISAPVERYSFFSILYRQAGSTGAFTRLNNAYGVRGATEQNIFNSIQLNMPSTQRWEFQIEPYSGWEVRNNSVGNLYVLDAHLTSRQSVSEVGGITVSFLGEAVSSSSETFGINVGRRKASKGTLGIVRSDLSYFDNGDISYIDTWGKLAEAFVFEEVRSSAESGPEHEVAFINEICPNTTKPLYDDIALLGLNIMSSQEWQQFSQFSCYVTQGKVCRKLLSNLSLGSSHLFPDVLLDLMTNERYGKGDLIKDSMIDLDSFKASAQWCSDRQYYFDGVVADRVNLRQWAADTAATHLLTFGEVDGKFFLKPAMPTGKVPIKALFTAGNILEGSFQLQYLDPEDRDPIRVSVRYREERASNDLANPGLFPVVREILVREGNTLESAPVESLDMSDYATNRQHAIDAAKYFARVRRLATHTIRFSTTHEGVLAHLAPSDYIRVGMDCTEYDEFNNGVVTAAGDLISTQALNDGSYTVIAWNGDGNRAPYETGLTVTDRGTRAAPTGILFTIKKASTQVRTYQVEKITPNEDGTFSVEAVHAPTTAAGVLELADGFDTASNWIIQE